MGFPDPRELRRRKKYGREEYLQDMLACLIAGGEAPRWNQPVAPSARGHRLMKYFAERSGLDMPPDGARFVNEFQLPALNDGEPSGWPDFAYYTDDRLLIIELKTEPASHRRGQLSYYDALAAHHHPTKERRLVYLTPVLAPSAVHDPVQFTHVLLSETTSVISAIWASADGAERILADFVADFIGQLHEPWTASATVAAAPAATTTHGVGRALAQEVARDGKQRAVDAEWASPDDIERARIVLRDQLGAADLPVQPWVWNQSTSGGRPLTDSGRRIGTELRLSPRGRQRNDPPNRGGSSPPELRSDGA